MRQSIETIQADFDKLAVLSGDSWNHNHHYHEFLLRHVPATCQSALDLGCGAGTFSRHLAKRSARVLGVDLSPQMLLVAQERSAAYPNLEFQAGDFLSMKLSPASFDCIASIATLHHLPMAETLRKIKAALRPNGTLLILDLYAARTWLDYLRSAVAVPVNLGLRLGKTGRLFDSPEVRAAWTEHGRTDSYLTLAQVRELGATHLPGAIVRAHLLWRYSLIWRKHE